MKSYLVTTGVIFALITLAHIWRVFAETGGTARDPWFVLITLAAAALSAWAFLLLRRRGQSGGTGDAAR